MRRSVVRKNAITYLVVIIGFVVMQVLSSAGVLGNATKSSLIPLCAYIVLAVSLSLLVGVCGELSLGHAGFMGIGAFTGIVMAAVLQPVVPDNTVRLILAMVCGGVMAGIFGLLIGIPTLRLRGDYVAIVTLAFGEILKNIFGNLYVGNDAAGLHLSVNSATFRLQRGGKMLLGGPMGATGINRISSFPIGFALILFALFVVLSLINSKEGRLVKAVRDNRIAAESVDVNVNAFRVKAFVISAVLAGMAGVLFGLSTSTLAPAKFNFNTSINILVFVVLGSVGSMPGVMVGGILLGIVEIFGKKYIPAEFSDAIVFAVLIVILLVKPAGVANKQVQEKT